MRTARNAAILALIASTLTVSIRAADPRTSLRELRERMVREQIVARGVQDARVLDAMLRVRRHEFVPEQQEMRAYDDNPLPIGYGQTISQPYVVARMTELLQLVPGDIVLELGTGSGYQAAVAAQLCARVYSVEIVGPLAERAARTLREHGIDNVSVRHGDGYLGWPEHAPFDAIVVTAAAPHIPPPLVEQLAAGGRMVLPVGPAFATQRLMLVEKSMEGVVRTRSLFPVRFVPLTGGH